jgi:hypothetical protein
MQWLPGSDDELLIAARSSFKEASKMEINFTLSEEAYLARKLEMSQTYKDVCIAVLIFYSFFFYYLNRTGFDGRYLLFHVDNTYARHLLHLSK